MKLVYVAMSGGVDSSVAAALLKRRGFEVVGVFMKPWSPNLSTDLPLPTCEVGYQQGGGDESFCMWKEDREDAMRVAVKLGISFLTWDFSKEYKKSVTDYMVREYKAGRTPNPDVMCNKEIKFGLFFNRAMKEGADYIATGHYVRLKQNDQFQISNFESISNSKIKNSNIHSKLKIRNSKFSLWQAKDKNKDQSYFLWMLNQKILSKCLFPIGDYIKPEIRRMAKKFGLPNHDKKDSQGVCFIGHLDMKDFLKTQIKPRQGKIIHLNSAQSNSADHQKKGRTLSEASGKVIGTHDGVYYYTIGQRHGLDIDIGDGPYYVVSKDIKNNIIYVGKEKNLYSKKLHVSNISWVDPTWTWKPSFQVGGAVKIDVKIRYRSKSEKAILSKNGALKFLKPVRAITPGQSAVFYKGEELLGGGVIV